MPHFDDIDRLAERAEEERGADPATLEALAAHVAELESMAREFYAKAVSMRRAGRRPHRVPFYVPGMGSIEHVPEGEGYAEEGEPRTGVLELMADRDGSVATPDGKFAVGTKGFAVLYDGLGQARHLAGLVGEDLLRAMEDRDEHGDPWMPFEDWEPRYEAAAQDGGSLLEWLHGAMDRALVSAAARYVPNRRVKPFWDGGEDDRQGDDDA